MTDAATPMIKIFLICVAACLFSAPSHGRAQNQTKPTVVSLDYCADQFILSLADRTQIMALTRDAIEDHSFYRNRAQGIPLFGATAEEILHRTPDRVIRNWGGTNMLPLLARANIPVFTAKYGTGPEVLYENMRLMGAALQQSVRAEGKIRDHQNRLAAIKKHPQRALRAAYIAPGGITAGANTFVNDIIKLAGLTSFAEEVGLKGWQPLPLEALIQNPPDIIIGSFFDQQNIHVSHWSLSRHGQIKKMIDQIPTIIIPGRYLSCNGIFTIDAVEYIHGALGRMFK